MSKKIFNILFFLFCISLSVYQVKAIDIDFTNEETNYRLIIEDDANLLSEQEIIDLKDKMEPLTEYGNIAFKSIDYNATTTSSYASSYYHNTFGVESGTLFLIDMDNRIIYIFSDGSNYKTITTNKANIITDNVYKYATNGDYFKCAFNAFDQINTLLDGGKIAEPMRYISNILISITLAFLLGFIIVLCNTRIKKVSADRILKNCNISFAVSNIQGVKTGTHSEYSPVSDSSSSSSGGGGGGGSSGGGGGHSF